MARNKAHRDHSNGITGDPADGAASDQPVSSDQQPVEAVNVVSMEDFISRPDRADWLSVADAAAMLTELGATDIDAQKMRNAAHNRSEFRAAGAMLRVAVPGYEIKPLTYLHRNAVLQYKANNDSGNTRTGRVVANGKRWIIRVKAADQPAVADMLAAFGITLETASAPHKKTAAEDAAIGAGTTDVAQHSEAAEDVDNAGADQDNREYMPVEEFSTSIDS